MNKFKVGDRINVYAETKVFRNYKITSIEDNAVLFSTNRKGHKLACHYKAARKIKAKPTFYLLVRQADDTVVLKTFHMKDINEYLKDWDKELDHSYSILKVKETNDFDG